MRKLLKENDAGAAAMSLFVVNRYLAEEEDGSSSKETRSQLLLARLQQKSKERQQRSLTERPSKGQTPQQQARTKRKSDGSDESPQHKKRKTEAVPLCTPDLDIPDKLVKKKKKTDESAKDQVNTTATEADEQGTNPGGDEAEAEKDTSKQTNAVSTEFTVLGGFENKAVQKVHRVLPQWLAQPDVIHRDIKSNLVPIASIAGLSPQLIRKLQNNGIQHFFPVQAEVIPAILESTEQGLLVGRGGYKPRDICVSAPTGSGKTLAFVIPIIQALMQRVVCEVRALAVLPTKELAQQVCTVFMSYAEGTGLKVVMLAGQKSFSAEQTSLSELRGDRRCSLADIIVATPGRLVDHINKNSGLRLKHLRFLVMDEADRMVDSMHQSWLSHVVKAVYTSSGAEGRPVFRRTEPMHVTAASLSPPQMPLQKLLFSATLTQNPEKLQQLGLHQPRLFSSIHAQPSSTPAAPALAPDGFDFPQGLTEYYVPCTLSNKPLLILHFILHMKLKPILCFTNSRETAHRLFLLVQLFGGIHAAEFSSRLSPGNRKKTLKEFEQGKVQLLISTDAAARGIDINGVKCVVNYDAPQFVRTYIHRIGRTARAGKSGLAFTFLFRVQEKRFLQMVQQAGSPGIQKQLIKPQSLQSMEVRYEQTLQELATVLKDEKAKY